MKNLSNLLQKLNPPNERHDPQAIPTFRDVLVDSLMFARPKTGYEAIKLFRLGERIAGTRDGTLALEDADFALVSDALNQNHAAYLAWVMGQAMAALIAWERDQ